MVQPMHWVMWCSSTLSSFHTNLHWKRKRQNWIRSAFEVCMNLMLPCRLLVQLRNKQWQKAEAHAALFSLGISAPPFLLLTCWSPLAWFSPCLLLLHPWRIISKMTPVLSFGTDSFTTFIYLICSTWNWTTQAVFRFLHLTTLFYDRFTLMENPFPMIAWPSP